MPAPINKAYSAQAGATLRIGFLPPAPVAEFIGSPLSGTTPLTVTFTNQSTGVISDYLWNFGDGGTSTSVNPSYPYLAAGSYTVTLTVTGPGGSNTRTRTTYVTATTSAPPPPPPPPPPPSGTLVSIGVRSEAGGTVPFQTSQIFEKGALPSGTSLSGLQTEVLTTWDDNSAKQVRVSGTITGATAGVYTSVALAAGTAASGTTLTLANLKSVLTDPVTITAGSFGSASFTNTDWDTPLSVVATGPKTSEWIFSKAIGSDNHLKARLRVVLHSDLNAEVYPRVENCTLLVAAPTSKSAIYTFSMGGTQRYTSTTAIDLPHHGWIDLLPSDATSHWLTTAHNTKFRHDGEYMMATGLVPSYSAKTPASATSITSLPSSYVPLAQGSYPAGMGSGGYSNSIGLLPEWDVVHLTGEGAETYNSVLWMASNAGRYGLGYRDETASGAEANRPALVKNFNVLTIKYPTSSTHPGWTVPPQTSGTDPAGWATSHHPSIGYLAYLLTANPFHLDTMHFANTYNSLSEPYTERNGVSGVWRTTAAGATRHTAWCLRTLAQCITATPDSDTAYKTALRNQYKANIDHYWSRYINQTHNPFGFVTPYSDYTAFNPVVTTGATTTVIPMAAGALGGAPYTKAQDGQYVGMALTISGETRTISAYVASTETITVSTPFSSAPASGTPCSVSDNKTFDAPWMGNFFIASLGLAKDMELGLDATTSSRFDAFYTWKAKTIVGLTGFIGTNEFCYRDFGTYSIAVAPFDPGVSGYPRDQDAWNLGTGPWFSDWGAIWNATFSAVNNPAADTFPPWAIPAGGRTEGNIRTVMSPEFPTAEAIPALAYAMKHGMAGAEGGWQRVTSAANWYLMTNGFDTQPVHAVSPYKPYRWRRGLSKNQWTAIANTAESNLAATRGGNISFAGVAGFGAGNTPARKNAYGGAGWHSVRGTLFNWGGGHGDYYGNEVIALNLRTDVPAWAELARGSAAQDFPAANASTNYVGYTLSGCTTTRLYCFGVSTDHVGKEISVNSELTTVTAVSIQGHYMDVSPPLSIAPASRVDITRTLAYTPDTYDKSQVICRYRDKFPSSRHVYYGLVSLEREAHNVLLSTNGSASPLGTGIDPIEAYKLNGSGNSGYLEFGTYPFMTGGAFGGPSANIVPSLCKHPSTEVIYGIIGQALHIVTPSVGGPTSTVRSGGTYTSVSLASDPDFNPGSYTSMVVNTRDNVIFWCNPAIPHTIQLNSGVGQYTTTARTLTGNSGLLAEFAALAPEGLGLAYSAETHCYYARARAAGDKVYVIDAATYALTTLPVVGSTFPTASTGGSSGGGHGIYNAWMPFDRGIIYQPQGEGDVYYLRIR